LQELPPCCSKDSMVFKNSKDSYVEVSGRRGDETLSLPGFDNASRGCQEEGSSRFVSKSGLDH
jgi:hypothetical protein